MDIFSPYTDSPDRKSRHMWVYRIIYAASVCLICNKPHRYEILRIKCRKCKQEYLQTAEYLNILYLKINAVEMQIQEFSGIFNIALIFC